MVTALPGRRVVPSGEGIISASASRCITQCAMFCSMYCKVMPLNSARFGSAWKKQAEIPILSMRGARRETRIVASRRSHRLGENPLEVRARALAGIGLVAGVVDRDVDQRRDVGFGHRPLGRV